MAESLKAETLKGALWTGLERFANQAVGFVVSIVLARLLLPSDYGIIGMMAVFLSISQLFIDSGFTSALIQKKDRTDDDFSTVFWCNLGIAFVCYAILFVAAPSISRFYHMPELSKLMRVLGLILIINAFYTVQVTRLTTMINFKTQAKVSFSSCVLTGVVGITLAYKGFGPWALVIQSVFASTYTSIVYWLISGWRPRLIFSRSSFKTLFAFGSKILAANILSTIYTNISPLIVGRKYSAASLGVYTRSDSLVSLPGSIYQSTLGRVIFPVLSSIQDDDVRLRAVYAKYLRLVTSVVAPSMLLLAAVSKPLILTLLGDKWLACVPFIMILSLDAMLSPIITINLNLLYVKGRSDIVLKLEVIKKIIAITIVVIAVQFGVIWLCVGRVIYGVIALFLNLKATEPFIGMSFWRQMREVGAIYVGGFVMAGCSHLICTLWDRCCGCASSWLMNFGNLLVAMTAGAIVYIVWSIVFKFDLVIEAHSWIASHDFRSILRRVKRK